MWLNTQRAELRRAAGMLRAIQSAISNDVGKEFFEATLDDESEAKALFERYQATKK